MRKIWKGIITLLCAATIAGGFAACNDAESAYDIAVKNGFVGTEEEWLTSLHGANGQDAETLDANDLYETAKKNGFVGTYLEFCSQIGIQALPANDTRQIAKNIMSVVEINCGFSLTTSGGFGRPSQVEYSRSMGSGVIIDLNKEAGSALIVTNYHVLYNEKSDVKGISDNIYVYLYGALNRFSPSAGDVNGNGMRATYVGGAMDYDIALLRVDGNEYLKRSAATEVKMGNSEAILEGEEVFAIGNPEGAGISVTNGILSVKSEYISISALDGRDENADGYVDEVSYRVMRTEAAINSGNSGGALFNMKGELIGITNAKSIGEETDNMGYALPITQVNYLCDNILDNDGMVKCATLGVMVGVTDSMAVLKDGVLEIVEEVTVTGAAENSKASSYRLLREGDVFKWAQLNGVKTELTRRYYLNDLLLTVRKGDTLTLGIKRDGTETTITIQFTEDYHFTQYK